MDNIFLKSGLGTCQILTGLLLTHIAGEHFFVFAFFERSCFCAIHACRCLILQYFKYSLITFPNAYQRIKQIYKKLL